MSRIRMFAAALVAAILSAAPVRAQATIDPGMSQAQVVAKLGEPLSTRSFRTFTYMMYANACEKKCGTSDIVTLEDGRVVDAVFRSRYRRYSGTSSSPRAIPAAEASKGKPTAPLAAPAKSTPNAKKPPYVEARL